MWLARLTPEAEILLTEEFVAGDAARISEEAWKPYAERVNSDISLSGLGDALDELIERMPPHKPAIDAPAAELINKHLRLPRRDAADAGVWRFLAIVFRPEFVRHRWGHSASMLRNHFWDYSSRPRPENNAFSRLWWVAELTREGSNYTRTATALGAHCKTLFRCQLGHYGQAVRVCIDTLGDQPQSVVDPIIRDINRQLALVPLESLNEEELQTLARTSLERQQSS